MAEVEKSMVHDGSSIIMKSMIGSRNLWFKKLWPTMWFKKPRPRLVNPPSRRGAVGPWPRPSVVDDGELQFNPKSQAGAMGTLKSRCSCSPGQSD